MMKKTFLNALGCLLILGSCSKVDAPITTPDTNLGYVSFTNVNSSSKSLDIFINTKKVNATAIAVNGTLTGIYAGVPSGTSALLTRDPSTVIPAIDYYTGPLTVSKGEAYSFFQYGVLTGGLFKGILLTTNRTISLTSTNANIRFLNISNTAPLLDFWMVRNEGTTAKDSVLLYSGVPSLATVATPDIASLSAYKPVAANKVANTVPGVPVSNYILRLKLASTNTIVASSTSTTIVPGRNYTFYARGTYPSTALSAVLDN